jgi:hypothetical protein
MTTYERCMKVGVMLNPITLNIQPQEGQGMWACGGEDCMTNIREALSGCGEQDEKGANKPKEGEGNG